jgi:hypothetical protein
MIHTYQKTFNANMQLVRRRVNVSVKHQAKGNVHVCILHIVFYSLNHLLMLRHHDYLLDEYCPQLHNVRFNPRHGVRTFLERVLCGHELHSLLQTAFHHHLLNIIGRQCAC